MTPSSQSRSANLAATFVTDGGSRVVEASDADEWTVEISRQFAPMTARPYGLAPFKGKLTTTSRGAVALTRIDGSAQHVHRGRHEIAKSPGGLIYLNVQLSGNGQVATADGFQATTVGQAALVCSTKPCDLEFQAEFSQLCVAMPSSWLTDRTGLPEDVLSGQGLDLSHGSGRIVSAAIDALLEANNETEVMLCADMLAHGLGQVVRTHGQIRTDRSQVAGMQAINALIARRFTDYRFSAALAAQELGCSLSTLHLRCQASGASFGTILMEVRLTAAARALRLAARDVGRVARVALACGFIDTAHFSRRFKRRFGTTPRRYPGI